MRISHIVAAMFLGGMTIMPVAGAADASPFDVRHEGAASVISLRGAVIARAAYPEGVSLAERVREKTGWTLKGPDARVEFACFPDRLEYTYQFVMQPRLPSWQALFLPMPGAADKATVLHGTYEKQPQTKEVTSADLKGAPWRLSQVRYVNLRNAAGACTVDVQPGGALGESPADMVSPFRTISLAPAEGGLALNVAIVSGRAGFPGTLRAKIILYAEELPYEKSHPFPVSNYRYGFERVVRLDFTTQRLRAKAGTFQATQNAPYSAQAGFGWLAPDTAQLEMKKSPLAQELVGEYVTSRQPGRFRVDLPPGHYYLTLNFGSADEAAGPLRVLVNGEERINPLALAANRFKSEVLWVTSTQDHLEIAFEGLDGASWQIGALTVSALSTLHEDFALTRPVWHFAR